MNRTQLIDKLQAAADDPMWADHAEVRKHTLAAAAQALRAQVAAQPPELAALVKALDGTSWSSWQSMANFAPALEAARRAVFEQLCRDNGPELFVLLRAVCHAKDDEARDNAISEALDMIWRLEHPQS